MPHQVSKYKAVSKTKYTSVSQEALEKFRRERTMLCELSLPRDMHDRVIGYLARRAGLEERRGGEE